jgi:hypothetical protein
MMRRVVVSFELRESRSYDGFFHRLQCMDAFPIMNCQWALQTPFTVQQIEKDLRRYIAAVDRLLVTYVGAMSSRNLINKDKFGSGPI